MKRQDGYTLIELLIVTAIISVLAAAALPQFYPFKTRAYDADAKSNLRNLFQACKGYWIFNHSTNSCSLSTVSDNEYGFVQSAAVEITVDNDTNNTESDFSASASHIWSSNIFTIDYKGFIASASSGGGQGQNNGQGQSNGQGQNDGGKDKKEKKDKKDKKDKKSKKGKK